MNVKRNFSKFWQAFGHPRVFIFMLAGTAFIFLTFLTSSNALEIAISSIASVFIGIGVNNFSSFETHVKDEQKLKQKIDHSIKIMEMTRSGIHKLCHEINDETNPRIKEELAGLEQFMSISIQLIREERSLE